MIDVGRFREFIVCWVVILICEVRIFIIDGLFILVYISFFLMVLFVFSVLVCGVAMV